MSDAVWPRLAAPFAGDLVAWVPVELAEVGDEVRVVALVAADALRERFDRTVGIAGWELVYAPLDAGAVTCHVTVAGVTKGAVAAAALVGGPVGTAEIAFARAAELFGLRAPFAIGATAWVPCDAETLVPLHAPEVDGTVAAPAAPPPVAATASAGAATQSAAAASSTPGQAAPDPGGASAVTDTAPPTQKPAGQQMIDRLVERLKDEGQGLAAARLLVRFGGYGKDPDTARELYAHLRALLRGEPVGAASGAGGGAA